MSSIASYHKLTSQRSLPANLQGWHSWTKLGSIKLVRDSSKLSPLDRIGLSVVTVRRLAKEHQQGR